MERVAPINGGWHNLGVVGQLSRELWGGAFEWANVVFEVGTIVGAADDCETSAAQKERGAQAAACTPRGSDSC